MRLKVKNVFSLLRNSLNSFHVKHLQECESTQDSALELALSSEKAQLVIADSQQKGRGRQGSTWLSSNNRSLTCTLALQLKNSTHFSHSLIPHMAGFALWKALVDFDSCFEKLCFKWPNDLGIFTEDKSKNEFKKVAGILVEIKKNILIVGWGLNLFSPAPLTQALALEDLKSNLTFDKKYFASQVATHFLDLRAEHLHKKEKFEDQFIEFLFQKAMRALWGRSLSTKLGEGKAVSLSGDGSLLVQNTKNQIVEIKSGEIILK